MSFPASIPVFTELQNDVDFVLAEHQNDPNDVITQIATMVGAVGSAQSYSTDVLDYLINHTSPILKKASASSLTLTIGTIALKNAAQSKRYLKKITAPITITASNLDTGSMAIGGYYVWAIGDAAATTFTVVVSTSGVAPDASAGLVYELLGWFWNEAGGALDITNGWVGNMKSRGRSVPNAVQVISSVQDTINDTSYGSDVTGMTLHFYASGDRPVFFNFHGFFAGGGSQQMNNDLRVIVDIDGSDESNSESASVDADTSGSGGSVASIHLNYMKMNLSAGFHTINIQGKVSAGSDVLDRKVFEVFEL